MEIMLSNPAVRNLIREGKTHQLYSVMQTSLETGMQTKDVALSRLMKGALLNGKKPLPAAPTRIFKAQTPFIRR